MHRCAVQVELNAQESAQTEKRAEAAAAYGSKSHAKEVEVLKTEAKGPGRSARDPPCAPNG